GLRCEQRGQADRATTTTGRPIEAWESGSVLVISRIAAFLLEPQARYCTTATPGHESTWPVDAPHDSQGACAALAKLAGQTIYARTYGGGIGGLCGRVAGRGRGVIRDCAPRRMHRRCSAATAS